MKLLDKVHRDNGIKSLRDIAKPMSCAHSRVSQILGGLALPADKKQAESLIRALGGSNEDVERGVKLYGLILSSSSDAAGSTRRSLANHREEAVGRRTEADGRQDSGDLLPMVGTTADLDARVLRAAFPLPYIRRDVEDKIRSCLISGRPVLLVGPSMVGKSRIAATLVKDMFATRRLLIPDGKEALASLGAAHLTTLDSVIFLDDIDRLIGPGGITQTMLRRLAERNVIVGTIRSKVYDEYQPTDQLRPPEWDVLSTFERVFIERRLSAAEESHLRQAVDDVDVRQRILRTGVGEYVGAAERIAEALLLARSARPVSLALIRGAGDWARAGMSTPVPARLLPVLAALHLDARGRSRLSDKREYEDALLWATRDINPTVSLLQPELHDAFSVFDYALDLISGDGDPIPEATWPVLIQNATPADLINIGRAAGAGNQPRVAEQVWRQSEDIGDPETAPLAALFLGAQLAEQGDTDGARAAYQRAIGSGHTDAAPGAAYNLGNLLGQQGNLEEARAAYQQAIDSGHFWAASAAALNLGNILRRQGDLPGAAEGLY